MPQPTVTLIPTATRGRGPVTHACRNTIEALDHATVALTRRTSSGARRWKFAIVRGSREFVGTGLVMRESRTASRDVAARRAARERSASVTAYVAAVAATRVGHATVARAAERDAQRVTHAAPLPASYRPVYDATVLGLYARGATRAADALVALRRAQGAGQ